MCVRATGVPGELLRWSRGGFTLMQARADGLQDVGTVKLGTLAECPGVAADATTGAAVVAGTDKGVIRVVQRAPGGGWGAPATLRSTSFTDPQVAVSARGDAVLTWVEYAKGGQRSRVRVARRPAGAPGWTVETLAPYRDVTLETVAVGMTAAGEALALLGVETTDHSGTGYVELAIAAPGAKFGAAQRIAKTRFGDEPALAVAPDGRALIAVAGFNDLSVYERPPGGAFGKSVSIFDGAVSDAPVIALRDDGAAAIAWRQGPDDPLFGVLRGAPGPFGAVQKSQLEIPRRRSSYSVSSLVSPGSVPYEPNAELRVVLGGDGRALVAYPTSEAGVGVATLTATGVAEPAFLGSLLRDPLGLTPLVLSDGTRALAWSDNRGQLQGGAQHGRVHFAVEGAPAPPEAAAPTITVLAPRRRALRPSQSLVVPIRCSAACDVRATAAGRPPELDVTATLTAAGTAQLKFEPAADPVAPANGKPLKITLRYGPPGSRAPLTKTFSVKLKRLPAPPLPHLLNVRVSRDGKDLVVRWEVDGPVREAYFIALAHSKRDYNEEDEPVIGISRHTGRHYRARLEGAAGRAYVTVALGQFRGSGSRTKTIRVG